MQSSRIQSRSSVFQLAPVCAALLGACVVGITPAPAQAFRPPQVYSFPGSNAPAAPPPGPGLPPPANRSPATLSIPAPPPGPLIWDAVSKTNSTKPGEMLAQFTFTATNISDGEVVILNAQGSCGCTTVTMPAVPWHIPPHTAGDVKVAVDLTGKSGTFTKSAYLTSTNFGMAELKLVVNMLTDPAMARLDNQQMARHDRQAVFKGDCAVCHAAPAQAKMAKELYLAACAICHDPASNPRASMVTDLHQLNHATDYAWWKYLIENGRPATLMPAFAQQQGGPLTGEQIDSLAKTLVKAFPSRPGLVPPSVTSGPATMPVPPPPPRNQ